MSNLTNSNPRIKILQRPAQSCAPATQSKGSVSNDVKTCDTNKKKKPVTKTYEEREAEYAQARLRILGAAYPDSDDEEKKDDKDSDTNSKPSTPTASDTQSAENQEMPLVNGIIKNPSSPNLPIKSSIDNSGIAVRSDS